MPDAVDQTATPGTPAPPVGGAPIPDTAFRFKAGAGVPEWAVGLTVNEVNAVGKAFEVAQRTNPQSPIAQDKPWEKVAPQPPQTMATADEWIATPDQAFNKSVDAVIAQRLGPMFGALAGSMTQTVKSQAELQHADAFKRWGTEIESEIAVVPPEQRSLALYAKAVDIVKGRHVEELAEERMQQRLAGLPVMERSGGTAGVSGVPAAVDFSALPPKVKETWEKIGVTEASINEDCARWGIAPKDFLAMTARNDVVTETVDGTFQVNPKALGIPAGGYR